LSASAARRRVAWTSDASSAGTGSFREGWKAGVGQPIMSMAGYVFSTSRRTLAGHVAARKWKNAVKEVARKVAIHSALQAAAGGA